MQNYVHKRYIVFFAFIVSCGNEEYQLIHPDLQSIYNNYVLSCNNNEYCARAKAYTVDVLTYADDLDGTSIGVCYFGSERKIFIKRNLDITEYSLYSLVWHELGHCMHRLEHSDTSIMYESLIYIESEDEWERAKTEFYSIDFTNKNTALNTSNFYSSFTGNSR